VTACFAFALTPARRRRQLEGFSSHRRGNLRAWMKI